MIFHIWPRALRFIYFVYKIRGTKRAPRGTYTESCFPVSVSLSHVGIKQNIAMLCGTNYDMYKLVKKGLPFKEFVVTCICFSLFVFLLMAGAGTPASKKAQKAKSLQAEGK